MFGLPAPGEWPWALVLYCSALFCGCDRGAFNEPSSRRQHARKTYSCSKSGAPSRPLGEPLEVERTDQEKWDKGSFGVYFTPLVIGFWVSYIFGDVALSVRTKQKVSLSVLMELGIDGEQESSNLLAAPFILLGKTMPW